jgi:hypothetical protein
MISYKKLWRILLDKRLEEEGFGHTCGRQRLYHQQARSWRQRHNRRTAKNAVR